MSAEPNATLEAQEATAGSSALVGFFFGAAIVVVAAIGFVSGYMTHQGRAHQTVEDFGSLKLSHDIYDCEFVRSTKRPPATTLADIRAEREGEEVQDGKP